MNEEHWPTPKRGTLSWYEDEDQWVLTKKGKVTEFTADEARTWLRDQRFAIPTRLRALSSVRITVCVTEDDMRLIKEIAEDRGLTISAWARETLRGAL